VVPTVSFLGSLSTMHLPPLKELNSRKNGFR
jgi:hypothetical protein